MQIKPETIPSGNNNVPIEIVNNTNPADTIIEIRTPTQTYKIPVSRNQYSINIYPISEVQAPTGATQLSSYQSGPLERGLPEDSQSPVPQHHQPIAQSPLVQHCVFSQPFPQSPVPQHPFAQSPVVQHNQIPQSPNQARQGGFTFGSAAPRGSPVVVRGEYAQKLDQLTQMGFDNKKKNIKLLNKFNGDVSMVVKFYQKKMNKCYDQKLNKAGRLEQKLRFLKEPNPRARPIKQENRNLYATQLQYLNQQGFKNDKLNVKLLYKFNGSTVSVINWIQGRQLLLQSKLQLVNDALLGANFAPASPAPSTLVNSQHSSPAPVVFLQQPVCPGSPMVIFPSIPQV